MVLFNNYFTCGDNDPPTLLKEEYGMQAHVCMHRFVDGSSMRWDVGNPLHPGTGSLDRDSSYHPLGTALPYPQSEHIHMCLLRA